jgi:hypothetical protein
MFRKFNNSVHFVQCGGRNSEKDGHYKSNFTISVSHYKYAVPVDVEGL